ncbi:MAG: hypothetical protein EA392_13230 [Cryomorphaceae bacterium]|nr:MAG: hypothetical protein EA392_13230 [Cryomorphaceae bacterium]
MSMKLHIVSTVQLRDGCWHRDGLAVTEWRETESLTSWLSDQYRQLNMAYPKFFKMDSLCKLATLAVEVLVDDKRIVDPQQTGILIFNRTSSIVSDCAHQELITDTLNPLPSPAVFVYTLPNIMLGEIAIRYRLSGENLCVVTDAANPDEILMHAKLMMESGMNELIVGWVDLIDQQARAWMMHVKKQHGETNISQLSTQLIKDTDNIPTWTHSSKS